MMTFFSSYHESKNSIFEEIHLTLLAFSNDFVESKDSIEFWDFDYALFRISSIKFEKLVIVVEKIQYFVNCYSRQTFLR